MSRLLPVCYFPTKKMIVDDNQAFVQSLMLKFCKESYEIYNHPDAALQFLNNDYHTALPVSALLKADTNMMDDKGQSLININIDAISQYVKTSSSQEISVIFVDYHMPHMTGVEFLSQIQHLPMKKVLFTAEQNFRLAIDAFHAGLIDGYLRKEDEDFLEQFEKMQKEMELQYFTRLSEIIAGSGECGYLQNESLKNSFLRFLNAQHCASYSITDLQGNFECEDNANKKHHVLIRRKDQLEELASVAEEDGARLETINKIRSGQVIPYFGNKPYWQVPGSEWDAYLHAAERLGVGDNDDLYWVKIHEAG